MEYYVQDSIRMSDIDFQSGLLSILNCYKQGKDSLDLQIRVHVILSDEFDFHDLNQVLDIKEYFIDNSVSHSNVVYDFTRNKQYLLMYEETTKFALILNVVVSCL